MVTWDQFDENIRLRKIILEYLKLPKDETDKRITQMIPFEDEYGNKTNLSYDLKRQWDMEIRVYVNKLLDELIKVISYSAIHNPDNLKELFKDTKHIKFDENNEAVFEFSPLIRLSFAILLISSYIENPDVRNFILQYLEMGYQYNSDESIKTKIKIVNETREINEPPHEIEKFIVDSLMKNLYSILESPEEKSKAYERLKQDIEKYRDEYEVIERQ